MKRTSFSSCLVALVAAAACACVNGATEDFDSDDGAEVGEESALASLDVAPWHDDASEWVPGEFELYAEELDTGVEAFAAAEGIEARLGHSELVEGERVAEPDVMAASSLRLAYNQYIHASGDLFGRTFNMLVGGPCHPGYERAWGFAQVYAGNCSFQGWLFPWDDHLCYGWFQVKQPGGFGTVSCSAQIYETPE